MLTHIWPKKTKVYMSLYAYADYFTVFFIDKASFWYKICP